MQVKQPPLLTVHRQWRIVSTPVENQFGRNVGKDVSRGCGIGPHHQPISSPTKTRMLIDNDRDSDPRSRALRVLTRPRSLTNADYVQPRFLDQLAQRALPQQVHLFEIKYSERCDEMAARRLKLYRERFLA